MFDKYLNKKVRVLVSTKSGAGMSNGVKLMDQMYLIMNILY